MSTLDDKLRGEKKHYYCDSDSDDELNAPATFAASGGGAVQSTEPYSTNTGPKGVLNDWRKYQQAKKEAKHAEELRQMKFAEKLSLSCKTYLELEEEKQQESDLEQILDDDSDPFLNQYRKKRMKEMMGKANRSDRKFGKLIKLSSGETFLETIEAKDVLIICHISNQPNEGCVAMDGCLECLASLYPFIKFCTLDAKSAGMSENFKKQGVPALLIYKNGILVGNFVRLTEEFGEDFYASDVESFLVSHGFLPDKNLIPELMTKTS